MNSPTPLPPEESVGLSYAAGPLRLSAAQIAEFATATGAAPERFGGSPQVPHTVAASLTAPVQEKLLDDDRLAIDLARTMHTEQSVTVHAPLAPETDYQAEARIEAVRDTAAGRMLSFRTTLRGPDDAIVQELTTTLLTAAPAEEEGQGRG